MAIRRLRFTRLRPRREVDAHGRVDDAVLLGQLVRAPCRAIECVCGARVRHLNDRSRGLVIRSVGGHGGSLPGRWWRQLRSMVVSVRWKALNGDLRLRFDGRRRRGPEVDRSMVCLDQGHHRDSEKRDTAALVRNAVDFENNLALGRVSAYRECECTRVGVERQLEARGPERLFRRMREQHIAADPKAELARFKRAGSDRCAQKTDAEHTRVADYLRRCWRVRRVHRKLSWSRSGRRDHVAGRFALRDVALATVLRGCAHVAACVVAPTVDIVVMTVENDSVGKARPDPDVCVASLRDAVAGRIEYGGHSRGRTGR
mmetsp:Transcript_9725/g.30034  ORF Transcript_9725/g.30034 Transcript_9725/m.30034 type:complete len:316 (+) Transcript_9725:577-1524(+)